MNIFSCLCNLVIFNCSNMKDLKCSICVWWNTVTVTDMQKRSFYWSNSGLRHSLLCLVWQLNALSDRLCVPSQTLQAYPTGRSLFRQRQKATICPSWRTGSSCTQRSTHSFHWLPAELLAGGTWRGFMSHVHCVWLCVSQSESQWVLGALIWADSCLHMKQPEVIQHYLM